MISKAGNERVKKEKTAKLYELCNYFYVSYNKTCIIRVNVKLYFYHLHEAKKFNKIVADSGVLLL